MLGGAISLLTTVKVATDNGGGGFLAYRYKKNSNLIVAYNLRKLEELEESKERINEMIAYYARQGFVGANVGIIARGVNELGTGGFVQCSAVTIWSKNFIATN